MVGICKFCGKEKELVQSHIIPKCLHATNQGRMVGINATTKFDMNPNAQNGYKERLLCADCDNKLGVFDNYAKKFFYDIIPNAPTDISDGFNIYNIQSDKFDYEKLYKFFVSVLWRCSISSKRVDLKKYQQIAFDILTDKAQIQPDLFLPIICKKEIEDGYKSLVMAAVKNNNIPEDKVRGIYCDIADKTPYRNNGYPRSRIAKRSS